MCLGVCVFNSNVKLMNSLFKRKKRLKLNDNIVFSKDNMFWVHYHTFNNIHKETHRERKREGEREMKYIKCFIIIQ